MAQWNITEAIEYYEKAGAARDQQLLTEFLREVQRENGGVIPKKCITEAAEKMGIRETFFYALIMRYPFPLIWKIHQTVWKFAEVRCAEVPGFG